MELVSLIDILKKKAQAWRGLFITSAKIGATLLFAYLASSTLATVSVNFLGKEAIAHQPRIKSESQSLVTKKLVNYRDLRKLVVKRNLFNSEGKVPEEKEVGLQNEDQKSGEFDENAKCRKSNLNLELVGTIFMGESGQSLVTIKEKGYNIADIYRKGETIIGHDETVIHAITPLKVILNNGGVKECIEISTKKRLSSGFNQIDDVDFNEPDLPPDVGLEDESGDGGGPVSSTVSLESSYVEDELGPGFSKILESGRLVPHNRDGKMVGFKLIGVKSGSLWRRMGLSSGDVITGVNDTSMAQPDQGFALYQALQDNREIRIDYLKGSKAPGTIGIEIK